MTRPGQPFALTIVPDLRRPADTTLVDFLQSRPEYRDQVRGGRTGEGGHAAFGETVIMAVLSQAALVGFFRVVKTWIEQQRSDATVRVKVGNTEVEVKISSRSDPATLASQLISSAQELVDKRQPGEPPASG